MSEPRILRGTEIATCVNCNKKFLKRIKPQSGHRYIGARHNHVRGSNVKTCSPKCSRENNRRRII